MRLREGEKATNERMNIDGNECNMSDDGDNGDGGVWGAICKEISEALS